MLHVRQWTCCKHLHRFSNHVRPVVIAGFQDLQHVEGKAGIGVAAGTTPDWSDFPAFKMPAGYKTLKLQVDEPGLAPQLFMKVRWHTDGALLHIRHQTFLPGA